MKACIALLLLFPITSCLHQQIGFKKKVKRETLLNMESNLAYSFVMDFKVQRLSGARVHLSWHAIEGVEKLKFQVYRKIGRDGDLSPVTTIDPSGPSDQITDYTFTDLNAFADSSYYTIMQQDQKGSKYFSRVLGVEGAERK